jgi:hypothetical protein
MATFTIDAENNITAYNSPAEANGSDGGEVTAFDSQAALAKLSAEWPIVRLVEVWNGIPGQTPVKKFQDRKKAVARIWAAIQPLADTAARSEDQPAAQKRGKASKRTKSAAPAKKATKKASPASSERSNKRAEILAMMSRAKGVTLAEIMEHTGWQAHTVRGFVSVLGSKGGQKIESSKNASGERMYRITK